MTLNDRGAQGAAQFVRLLFSGALAAELVGFTQLLGRDKLDLPLTISVYCFAISFPFVVLGIVLLTLVTHTHLPDSWTTLGKSCGGLRRSD